MERWDKARAGILCWVNVGKDPRERKGALQAAWPPPHTQWSISSHPHLLPGYVCVLPLVQLLGAGQFSWRSHSLIKELDT